MKLEKFSFLDFDYSKLNELGKNRVKFANLNKKISFNS